MPWSSWVNEDPLPWLLEPENPSARYLTLSQLLESGESDVETAAARAAISDWPPVRHILRTMDPINLWGRARAPFFGGALSTASTLALLADLGLPRLPQVEAGCENLLQYGQAPDGGFTHDGDPAHTGLCYTGQALSTLIRCGYGDHPGVQAGLDYVTRRAAGREWGCAYSEHTACQWGIAKALGALAELPPARRTAEIGEAVAALAEAVLNHTFDFPKRDARWLDFGFPLDYSSDLSELCNFLARLGFGPHPRFRHLFDLVLDAQLPNGRWPKRYGTRALVVEYRDQPSKWLTIRVLRTIKHARQEISG